MNWILMVFFPFVYFDENWNGNLEYESMSTLMLECLLLHREVYILFKFYIYFLRWTGYSKNLKNSRGAILNFKNENWANHTFLDYFNKGKLLLQVKVHVNLNFVWKLWDFYFDIFASDNDLKLRESDYFVSSVLKSDIDSCFLMHTYTAC